MNAAPKIARSGGGLRRAAGRLTGVSLALAALLVGAEALAAQRVVLMPFSGKRPGPATAAVRRALGSRVRLVSPASFRRKARVAGLTGAASALGVNAVVKGAIARRRGRWVLRITVIEGASGRTVGTRSFPLRGTRVDSLTARRIATAIASDVARTRRPRRRSAPAPARAPAREPEPAPEPVPEPAPAPAPSPEDSGFDDGGDIDQGDAAELDQPPEPGSAPIDDDLGFATGDAGSRAGRRPPRRRVREFEPEEDDDRVSRRRRSRRPPWESIVEASAGLVLLRRTFAFNEPVKPPSPPDYKTPSVVAAIFFEGSLYPGAAVARGFLANIGLSARFYRVLGLKSQVSGASQLADTTVQEYEIGLRYRWNVLDRTSSPILRFGVDFGQLSFAIDDQLNLVELPNVTYTYMKPGVAVDVPFYQSRDFAFGGSASFDYLWIFSAGDINLTESGGYGDSFTGGIDFGVGLYATYAGFFGRVTGFYRRIFYSFDDICMRLDFLKCNYAGGALDVFMGAALHAGYAY